MNKDQRKYLTDAVTKAYTKQRDTYKETNLPKLPSLNNYIVAAILDETIRYQPQQVLADWVRERVLALGPSEAFVNPKDRYGSRISNDDSAVSVIADKLFVLPAGYVSAMADYNAKRAVFDKYMADLDAIYETVKMKINLGSNAMLDRLILEADTLVDITLVGKSLINISGGTAVTPVNKLLTEGSNE